MSPLRIDAIAACLYEHDRFVSLCRRPSWPFASTRKQAEYRARAEALDVPLRQAEPISSAPKDGAVVVTLTWHQEGWVEIGPARFERDQRVLVGGPPAWIHDEHGDVVEPTHWFALPDAPVTA